MMFNRFGLIGKAEAGLALAELLVAVLITSLIAGGVTMAIFQVVNGSASSTNQMSGIRQVQSAGYWVSHDAQMAQTVIPTGASGFPLTLSWTDSGGNVYRVVYSLVNGELQRDYHAYSTDGQEVASQTSAVARYIDPTGSRSYFGADGVLVLEVTSVPGATSQAESKTGLYRIVPRPGS